MDAITWAAGNGSEIKVEIRDDCGDVVVDSWINGKWQGACDGPVMLPSPVKVGDSVAVSKLGRSIGLTQERHDAIVAAIEARKAEFDADPAVVMGRLIEERRGLAAVLNSVRSYAYEMQANRIERARVTGLDSTLPDTAAEEAEAVKALADFDAAHPEVIAEIRAERKERAEQHMWD
jgi:uncharacterized protein YhaN